MYAGAAAASSTKDVTWRKISRNHVGKPMPAGTIPEADLSAGRFSAIQDPRP